MKTEQRSCESRFDGSRPPIMKSNTGKVDMALDLQDGADENVKICHINDMILDRFGRSFGMTY